MAALKKVWQRFRSWPTLVQVIVWVFAGLLVLGSVLPDEEKDDEPVTADRTTTTDATDDTATTEAEDTTTTDIDSTTSVPRTTTSAAAGIELTGFGATHDVWDEHHDQAPGFAPGSAYGPIVGNGQPQYGGVCCEDLVISYTLNMPYDSSMELTEARVQQEFPADATAGELVDRGDCTMQEWRSASIEAVLEDDYIPLVAYFPPDPTYPPEEQRWSAIFTISTPGELNEC